MNSIRIDNKEIADNNSCFIIAEAGVNHNGDLNLAKQLVDVATEAGANAVKFQTFKAGLLTTKDAEPVDYQKKNKEAESQYSMLKKLELSEEDFQNLKIYCVNKGIMFLSTPHSDKWSVDLLEKLDIKAYKIGSGDLTNLPFLKYVAKKGKPIILGTGMSTLEEIREAQDVIEKEGNNDLIVLHCTTMYPCPEDKVNLRAISTIKKELGVNVGYSDHTIGLETSVIATCLGLKVYEKHFTLDKNMEGPDHRASLDAKELKMMVKAIRFIENNMINDPETAMERLNQELGYKLNKEMIKVILGEPKKKPNETEIEMAKVVRKSIIATNDIKQGEKISEGNTGIKRPGTGLAPRYYDELLGKKANRDIAKDDLILKTDVS